MDECKSNLYLIQSNVELFFVKTVALDFFTSLSDFSRFSFRMCSLNTKVIIRKRRHCRECRKLESKCFFSLVLTTLNDIIKDSFRRLRTEKIESEDVRKERDLNGSMYRMHSKKIFQLLYWSIGCRECILKILLKEFCPKLWDMRVLRQNFVKFGLERCTFCTAESHKLTFYLTPKTFCTSHPLETFFNWHCWRYTIHWIICKNTRRQCRNVCKESHRLISIYWIETHATCRLNTGLFIWTWSGWY